MPLPTYDRTHYISSYYIFTYLTLAIIFQFSRSDSFFMFLASLRPH